MSFLQPDAVAKFKSVQSFLLWFQMAYSIWQFIRTAKFFRLPYVTVSSSWHGFDSWYKTRKLIMMHDELDVDKDAISDLGLQSLSSPTPGMTIEEVGDCNVKVSFTDLQTPYTCLTSKHRAMHMVMLQAYRRRVQFGRDDDLLWPSVHLIRRLSFEDAMSHVLSGKGYSAVGTLQTVCFFDYSSRELLNQNFVRFASIWPLILQARHYDFWSIVFSLFIILMDVFSYGANKLWRFVQYWVSRLVKVVILQFSKRKTRVFLFTFMGSISTQFVCSNFVTEEASSKVVKRVLLATHIKFDKRKVDTLDPILYTNNEVPRKDGNHEVTQTIPFTMAGVQYSALVQPRLSEQWRSSVHFNKPNVDIKVKDWTIEDMAYFLEVCKLCNEFKFSPIKELDERNTAMCSSFSEIVHGVKTRNFVICEFKLSQRLFFT